jgi:hypothetical protein
MYPTKIFLAALSFMALTACAPTEPYLMQYQHNQRQQRLFLQEEVNALQTWNPDTADAVWEIIPVP